MSTPGSHSAAREFREWFELPMAGSLLNPGVLAYTLTLRPVFQQRTQPGFAEALGARQLDAALGVRLLANRPVNLAVDLLRASGSTDGGLGSRRSYFTSHFGATLWWRNPVMPAHLAYTARSAEQTWSSTPGSAGLRSAGVQRVLRLTAGSSRTSLNIERSVYEGHGGVGDAASWNAEVLHALRWGKGSRLESSWDYGSQRGSSSSSRGTWSERLHLQHTGRVGSDHFFQRSAIGFGDQASRSVAMGTGVTARLGRWASAGVAASRHSATAGSARSVAIAAAPRLGLHTLLPAGWTFSFSGALGFERRLVTGAPSTAPVVDERHQVTQARSVMLAFPEVEPLSILVRSSDGVTLYVEGADYSVSAAGSATRLDVPPGSRIQVGETVLVSYRYRVAPQAGRSTRQLDYDVTLRRGGVSLRHRRLVRQSGDEPSRGSDAPLWAGAAFDEARTVVEFRRRTPIGNLTLEGGLRAWKRPGERAGEYQAGGTLEPPSFGPLGMSSAVYWSASRAGGVDVGSLSVTSTVWWTISTALKTRAVVESFRWAQAGAVPQRFLTAALAAEWQVGSTEMALRGEVRHRSYLVRDVESRLTGRLVRRF